MKKLHDNAYVQQIKYTFIGPLLRSIVTSLLNAPCVVE